MSLFASLRPPLGGRTRLVVDNIWRQLYYYNICICYLHLLINICIKLRLVVANAQISNSVGTQIEFDLILLSQSGFDYVDKGCIYSRIEIHSTLL